MKQLFVSRDRGQLRGSLLMRAFTLVEIMIAVTLMSVIVLGLMAMFTQTQRAFRLGMNQTDVLEAGRIATDMIVREMEQMTPIYKTNMLPNSPRAVPSFFADLADAQNSGLQELTGGGFRTNALSDLFFVKRENLVWTGIGYFVRTNAQVAGAFGPVGTLYRYEINYSVRQFDLYPIGLINGFFDALGGNPTNVSKVLEGVVHFQVRAFDTNGVLILPYALPRNRVLETGTNISGFAFTTAVPGNYRYWMPSNAVPAVVELEIGILEQQTYERYKNIPVMQRQREYYTNHAANVHVFRQRIPVRKVDLAAYK